MLARFDPVPSHICEANLRAVHRLVGGSMSGDVLRIPSPGKSRANRSTVVMVNPNVQHGLGIHCHNDPDAGAALAIKAELAERLGWESSRPTRHARQAPSRMITDDNIQEDAKALRETQAKDRRNKDLWQATEPTGEPLRAFLHGSRGLSGSVINSDTPDALRYHSALPYWEQDGLKPDGSPKWVKRFTSPAMVARVQDCETGQSIGLHLTWLTMDGRKHPDAGENVRKMRGNTKGGALRLARPGPDGVLAVAEGIESALAMTDLTGIPCHAALSAVGIANWTPPPGATSILIAHDDDANGVGQAGGAKLAARLIALGIPSRPYPPAAAHRAFTGCCDWNDALLGKRNGSSLRGFQ